MLRTAFSTAVLLLTLPLASCTSYAEADEQTTNATPVVAVDLPPSLGPVLPVWLDTALLDRQVRSRAPVSLPFVRAGRLLTTEQLVLQPVPLRALGLRDAILKDGQNGRYRRIALGPAGSYQGRPPTKRGSAAATITAAAVEANILTADGWSIVEPLEPLLRLHGVPSARREEILGRANHIAYHVEDLERSFAFRDAAGTAPRAQPRQSTTQQPTTRQPTTEPLDRPLLATIVADGDVEFLAAYPLGSVMPFWRKQEAILNVMSWLYGCVEPASSDHNKFADCGNDLDGGHWDIAVQLRIERLEAWSSGGPDASERIALLHQSIRQSHQSEPPCCGPPHTAGQADLVHFFSGKPLAAPAGEAAGVGGIAIYGSACTSDTDPLCHHAFSQMVPHHTWPALAFHQQILVGHEIGHNVRGPEDPGGFGACWAFEQRCGPALMASLAFGPKTKLLYFEGHCKEEIEPTLRERLRLIGDEALKRFP